MIDICGNIVRNVIGIWTSDSSSIGEAYMAYATGTIFLFMPVYLIFGGLMVFGVKVPKALNKGLTWTLVANAALALLPFIIPLGTMYYGGRFLYGLATGRQVNAPRHRAAHREEPEADEDEPEAEEAH
jgi:hypothetical protein